MWLYGDLANLQRNLLNLTHKTFGTREALAAKTEIPESTIYAIINGNSKNPTLKHLLLIANALDTTIDTLLSDEEPTARIPVDGEDYELIQKSRALNPIAKDALNTYLVQNPNKSIAVMDNDEYAIISKYRSLGPITRRACSDYLESLIGIESKIGKEEPPKRADSL